VQDCPEREQKEFALSNSATADCSLFNSLCTVVTPLDLQDLREQKKVWP
jgi:hypothetical protein